MKKLFKNILFKSILYILSLQLLFLLLFIINTKIYKSDFLFKSFNLKFLSRDFIEMNFIIWICYSGIFLGILGYIFLKCQMKKNKKLPFIIEKIDFNLSDSSSFIAS